MRKGAPPAAGAPAPRPAPPRGEALAKDRKPDDAPARGGNRGGTGRTATTGKGGASKGTARPAGKNGRTPPPTQVFTQQRKPWGLIAGAVAVVVFAAAVLTYAVLQVNKANEDKVSSPDQIAGVQTFSYAAGEQPVQTRVSYTESPPVGGPHDPFWADCTGSVYPV